jgi:glyoxylase-like metal-dependent hydrolase (beta-lactamase superfamily II)/rhodanese-related sulfurtransferase
MTVATLEMTSMAPSRDCKSYLLFDPATREAAVIDARFDEVAAILKRLNADGLALKYAIDTHTHADHLSGSDRLRNLTGCKVVMSSATKSQVADTPVEDGQELGLGGHSLRFLHTPGHTPDSMCIFDGRRVYTGDTLFINGAARTDFMGGSSAQLYDSFRKLEALGDEAEVWPGHDYNGRQSSTIGQQREDNPAFAEPTKDGLVQRLSMKAELPANMAEILSFNTKAGLAEDRIVQADNLSRLGKPGVDYTLLDVRYAEEWQAGRAPGAVHVPMPEVKDRLDDIRNLPHPIVSVCRSGVRATMVMMSARNAGDEDWLLLEGGMLAWKEAGQPMESNGAEPDVIPPPHTLGGNCMAAGGSCAAG